MQKTNSIAYYSEFTNYLDSNSCYENFHYKTECAARCRKDNISEDLIDEASTLYMVHDTLEEIRREKPGDTLRTSARCIIIPGVSIAALALRNMKQRRLLNPDIAKGRAKGGFMQYPSYALAKCHSPWRIVTAAGTWSARIS